VNRENKMICPRCEQGDIAIATITKTGQSVYVCEECEAMWFAKNDIGPSSFVDFGTYMEEIGLLPLWDELSVNGQ
jgi:uncharacterized protein (DUF983 family)